MCSTLKVSSTMVPRLWISRFPVVSTMLQSYSGLFFFLFLYQNYRRFSLFLNTPPVPVILARLPHRAQTQLWVFPVPWDIIHPSEKSVNFSLGEPHCGCSQSLHFTICILLFPVWKWYMLKTKKKTRVSVSLFPVYIPASGPQAASLTVTFVFCCSVAKLCLTPRDPRIAAHQASLCLTVSWSLLNLLRPLCCPDLFLPEFCICSCLLDSVWRRVHTSSLDHSSTGCYILSPQHIVKHVTTNVETK